MNKFSNGFSSHQSPSQFIAHQQHEEGRLELQAQVRAAINAGKQIAPTKKRIRLTLQN